MVDALVPLVPTHAGRKRKESFREESLVVVAAVSKFCPDQMG